MNGRSTVTSRIPRVGLVLAAALALGSSPAVGDEPSRAGDLLNASLLDPLVPGETARLAVSWKGVEAAFLTVELPGRTVAMPQIEPGVRVLEVDVPWGAELEGGGLFLDGGTYEVVASTFAHNTAGRPGGATSFGGGIAIVSGGLLLGNSTLSENQVLAPTAGGADLAAESSSLGLQFSTVKALAAGPPASIELSQSSSMQAFASLFSAGCAGGSITSAGFNVEHPPGGEVTTQCDLDHVADVLSTEPLLRPLAGYGGPTPTHALLPAAEATTFLVPSGSCVDTDQRGAERLSLFCHSGAYEANATPPGPWIFSDGFESGDTAAWSAAVP